MPVINKQMVEARAEHLALVYLTRRDDITIIRHPAESLIFTPSGIDLLVSPLQDPQDIDYRFGVKIKGVIAERDLLRPEKEWQQAAPIGREIANSPIPVCLFVFVMENDQGYWKWLHQNAPLRTLDNKELGKTEELSRILDDVNAWYDSRRTLMAA